MIGLEPHEAHGTHDTYKLDITCFKNLVGKFIKFTDAVEEYELEFDAGMIAKITHFETEFLGLDEHGKEQWGINLFFDFSQYEEYNKQFMKPNFYDNNGLPTIKWSESKFYPSKKVTSYWFDPDLKQYPLPFEVVGDASYPTIEECLELIKKIATVEIKSGMFLAIYAEATDILERAGIKQE